MPGMTVELRACDRRRNRYRAWRVDAAQDRFGRWNTRVTFDRIGCDGRTQRHDFDSEAATTAFRAGLPTPARHCRKSALHSLQDYRRFPECPSVCADRIA